MKMNTVNSYSAPITYTVDTNGATTNLLLNGERVIRVSEGGECEVTLEIPRNGDTVRIVLSSEEAEYLVTALLAHQHTVMGYEATIEDAA